MPAPPRPHTRDGGAREVARCDHHRLPSVSVPASSLALPPWYNLRTVNPHRKVQGEEPVSCGTRPQDSDDTVHGL